MGLFATLVQKISDHPVLFIFLRGILENDFKAIRSTIRRELDLGPSARTHDGTAHAGCSRADVVGVGEPDQLQPAAYLFKKHWKSLAVSRGFAVLPSQLA